MVWLTILAAAAIAVALSAAAARLLRGMRLGSLLGAGAGLIAGLLAAALAAAVVPASLKQLFPVAVALPLLGLALAVLGLALGASRGAELERGASPAGSGAAGRLPRKVLDTSAIIDGRIADLCETGFLEGVFVVPQFVLRELQYIADSPDPLKRNRGRRGLDVLARMQKLPGLEIDLSPEDFPQIREVDGKLIALAQRTGGKIVTNDFNLNKVAGLSGVPVLNINQLANALKPVVLPGELMRVTVLKEGKEANQGVGYLDDGTMVVVDNARRFIGRPVEVVVSSVLQTTAGRMIFTQLREPPRDAPAPAPASGEPAA